MKTVTYEEFLEFDPCWLDDEDGAERIKAYFDCFGGRMSALDILSLDDVSMEDRLRSVLREEFIPVPILHEFGCVCAECALSLIDKPDPRSIKAVEIKRAWMRGEAPDEELAAACDAARDARDAAWAAREAAWAASWAASDAAWAAARPAWTAAWAARDAAWSACDAAWAAARPASEAARYAAYEAQAVYLIMALEEV